MREQTNRNTLNGVRGWLLLLCLILCVVSPALYFVRISFNPSPLWIIGGIALGSYGFVAGYKLWRIRKGAVKFARTFLIVLISVNACIALAVAYIVSPIVAAGDLAAVVWPGIWLLYLRRSARVAVTYGESSQGEVTGTSIAAPSPALRAGKSPTDTSQPAPVAEASFAKLAGKGSRSMASSAGKPAIVTAVILVAAFGCLLVLRPLVRYRYLKRGEYLQYRYNRYSGRTDKLTYGGWVPIGFDRPTESLPFRAVSISDGSWNTKSNKVCFDVASTPGYTVKDITIELKGAFFSSIDVYDLYDVRPTSDKPSGGSSGDTQIKLTPGDGTLLTGGTHARLCAKPDATLLDGDTWTYSVQAVEGWKQ